MDDEVKQFEAELARLRPAPPSRTLIKRVEAELATVVAEPRSLPWMEWVLAAALPAAALIAVLLTLMPRGKDSAPVQAVASVAPQESPLKPVAAEKVLVSAVD